MKTALILAVLSGVALMMSGADATVRSEEAPANVTDTNEVVQETTEVPAINDSTRQVVAYYFHGTVRCATCRRIEALTKFAIDSGFVAELTSGLLTWRPTNTDSSQYEHFLTDYQLFTKSVILSESLGGKELRWKNLDKIWEHVGDSATFVSYIRTELRSFLDRTE